ncbi:MAG: protein kinase domain-containing protein, partial [Planctomycetota bacterium]
MPEQGLQSIAAHLETCSECLAALSTIPEAEDSLSSGLRRPQTEEEFLDEPECKQAVMQFEALGSAPSPSAPAENAADLSLPRKLGRYQLLEELGRGGMGTVYLAEDTQLDRQVAIKIPHFRTVAQGDSTESPSFVERFYREAQAAAKIRHTNLCPVYDVGEIDGFAYLSMAYVRGKSLAKSIRGKVRFSQPAAAQIVRKLALAVQEAHAHGVVHRDIKPSNVIIAEDGEPILTDFGLARRVEADEAKLTHCGVIVGTPAYMAPEQVDADPEAVGPCSDIYSLGVVLYELLTGEVPFRGSLLSVVSQIGKDRPDPPSLRREGLDPRLEAICMKAMAKERADRYQSAQEMATALDRYLQDLPEETAHGPRRRRLAWIAGVAVVAVLLLAGVLGRLHRGEGTLVLEVNQPDVSVMIDGEPIQIKSPVEGIPVKAGRHQLEVAKKGFRSHRQTFTIGRGEKMGLVAMLRSEGATGGAAGGELLHIFLNPTRDAGDRFGSSLAAVRNKVLIGAPQDDTDGRNAGIAHLFSSSTGRHLLSFHNPRPAADDHFGEVVAAMDHMVLIGAPQPYSGGSGFVCLFDGSSADLLHRFQPPKPHPGDRFGSSIAALGKKVFIGAPRDDTAATDSGGVYVFELDGAQWKLRPGFLRHLPRANDCFGCSLAVVKDKLAVGATGDDGHGTDAGAIHLFDTATGRKLRTLSNPSPVAGDVFGSSIAAAGDRALVGAYLDDTGAENAGVAYLFDTAAG